MSNNDYWVDYWNNNPIINKENLQLQVGRSIAGVPIEEERWINTVQFISEHLELCSTDILLDIASGNGMLSIPFSQIVKEILCVDISSKLLSEIPTNNKIKTLVADVRKLTLLEEKYSKIVMYFALQHFTQEETIGIFEHIYSWLKKDGIAYIGDIPDINKLFVFFNNEERVNAYFNALKENKPIIGTWFYKEYLMKLADYVGFSNVEIVEQPVSQINSHYRFDLKLVK